VEAVKLLNKGEEHAVTRTRACIANRLGL